MLTSQLQAFHPILQLLPKVIPPEKEVYLVGGAVRDMLLKTPSNDFDFVVPSGGIEIARQVADALGGYFYPLDKDRDYGRVILLQKDEGRTILDFTPYQGEGLESDLRGRDFTINAMAIEIWNADRLLDPLGGLSDLRGKTLRACSEETFQADPIRILRAIRLATGLDLRIARDTREKMRAAAPQLAHPSAERIRDELFRILGGPRPSAAIRSLELLTALPYVLPELKELKGVSQPPPHIFDAWEHSLSALDHLERILSVLRIDPDPEDYASLHLGAAAAQLGRYRAQIRDHLTFRFTPDRTLRPLLFLECLYHDVGKPATRSVDENGRIRFFGHEKTGAALASQRGHALHLSQAETDRLKLAVLHHMRPLWLVETGEAISRRSIYRFFRSTGVAGVDICLISLADVAATYGPTLPVEHWTRLLGVIRTLLETWWEGPKEIVRPPSLVDGNDLMKEFGIAPGPELGRLLEAIREAQAAGEVTTRNQALDHAAALLASKDGS